MTVAGFAAPNQTVGTTIHFRNGSALTNLCGLGSGTSLSGSRSVGFVVNNIDEIVGCQAVPLVPESAGAQNKPFYSRNGILTELGLPDGCTGGLACDINDNGQIAGTVFAAPHTALDSQHCGKTRRPHRL